MHVTDEPSNRANRKRQTPGRSRDVRGATRCAPPDAPRVRAAGSLIFLLAAITASVHGQDCDGNGILDLEETRATLSFSAPLLLRVGDEPTTLAIADLDGDGRDEIVVTETKSNAVRVVWNESAGEGELRLVPGRPLCVGVDPRGIAIADVDGDGRPDLVSGAEARSDDPAGSPRARITIHRNAGDRTFAPICDSPCDASSAGACATGDFLALDRPVDAIRSLALDDLDGDGDLDVVVGFRNADRGVVSVLVGDGRGSFGPPIELASRPIGDSRYVATGDLDGDGLVDVASAAGEWLRGPVIDLAPAEPMSLELSRAVAKGIALADLDGDGSLDIAIARTALSIIGPGGGEVVILLGDGAGSFERVEQPDLSTLCDLQESILARDVDDDGTLDLVVTHVGDPIGGPCRDAGVSLLLGDGEGHFTAALFAPLPGRFPRSLAAADLDRDGQLDLVVALDVPGTAEDHLAILEIIRTPAEIDTDGDRVPDHCKFHRGDVDGDRAITLTDAVRILLHLFRGPVSLPCLEAADVDDDGRVIITDAVALLDRLFRGGATLPPPGLVRAGSCDARESTWTDASGHLGCEAPCELPRG